MSENSSSGLKSGSRRQFLRTGIAAAGGAAALATGARAATPDPEIVNKQVWNQALGEGVASRPYGMPSGYEAHVKRRNVEWLTASPESSVNFTPLHELDGFVTPNGLCFERHHAGIA